MKILNDDKGNRAGLMIANYFYQAPYNEKLSFSNKDSGVFTVTRYPYTLSDYLQTLLKTGFVIENVVEPRPTQAMIEQEPRLKFWQEHASLYLFFSAFKPA
jgi:hypothetical protein